MADINRELEELAELTQRVNAEMRMYGQLTQETADKKKDAEMKAKYGIENFTAASKKGGEALAALGQAAKEAGNAALQGSKKASSMNGAFDQLTESAKFAAVGLSLLIPGSALMKGVYAGITALATTAFDAANKYREVAVKISDQLFEGYSALAQSGAAASDGMTGLFEDAKKLGYSMEELSQYTNLVAEGSKDLALFGGTVFEGRKQFADMGKSFDKYSADLIAAGFTQTQINEGMMGYIKLQSRLGQSQGKTSDQLAEGARKYLLEMDGLTKLTGQTRKEMEDQRDRQMMNEQFAAKIRELQMRGTPEAAEAAKRLQAMGNMAARMGPDMEEAFLASVTGNYANEKAIGANIASQNQLMKSIQLVEKGLMTPAEAMQSTAKAMGKFGDSMNGLAQVNAFEAAFGIKYNTVLQARILSEGDIVENLNKAEAERKKQGAEGDKVTDAALAAQVNFQRAMRSSNETVERLFIPGMAGATNAAAAFATSAEGVAARMNKLFGISPEDVKKVGAAQEAEKTAKAASEAARAAEKTAQAVTADKKSTKQERVEAAQKAWQAQQAERNAAQGMPVPKAPTRSIAPATAPSKPTAPAAPAPAPAAPAPTAPAPAGPTTRSMAPTAPTKRSAAPTDIGGPQGGHAVEGGSAAEGKPRLARVSSASGKSTSVNEKYAPAFQGLLDYLGKVGYEVTSLGGYVDRDVRGKPGVKSIHAHGAAIDINPGANPLGNQLITDLPAEISSIAAGLGLGWGGNWNSRKDAMHFSAARSEGGSLLQARDGGMFSGPTSGYNVELHGKEAVIPLKDGAVPVSLNLKDAMAMPSMGGYSEYRGINQGPIQTDLETVKKLAEAAGAFDKASQTITDTKMWKDILTSGMATNYDLGMVKLGTYAIDGLGDVLAERLKEIKEQSNVDSATALREVREEYHTLFKGMADMISERVSKSGVDPVTSSEEITTLLRELVSSTKNSVDVQQKILATNY